MALEVAIVRRIASEKQPWRKTLDMRDAGYAVFFLFGCFWVVLAVVVWALILKAEGQTLKVDKWVLIVAVPIVLPLLAAFTIAAIYH